MIKEVLLSLLNKIEEDKEYEDILDNLLDGEVENQKLSSKLNPGVSKGLFNFYSELLFSRCSDSYKEEIQKLFLQDPKKIFVRLGKLFSEVSYEDITEDDYKLLRSFFPVIKEPINITRDKLITSTTEILFLDKYSFGKQKDFIRKKFGYIINLIFTPEDFKYHFARVNELINIDTLTLNISFEEASNCLLEYSSIYESLVYLIKDQLLINKKMKVLPFNEYIEDFIIRLLKRCSDTKIMQYKDKVENAVNDFLYESLSLYKLSEDLKDEVSENTLKKRREYYLTHGLKNIFPMGLGEDIEKHATLNPLLFDEDDELKPEIKEAIEKIVNQFIEDLKTDGVKIEVKDVILVGSNVSYNYTKDSDLDIHIIVDKDTLDCDPELYTLLYGAYRSLFNKNYDITIKGIPVEIYVELY